MKGLNLVIFSFDALHTHIHATRFMYLPFEMHVQTWIWWRSMIQRAKHGRWLDDGGWVTFHKRAYHWQEMPVCHESLTSIIDKMC